MTLKELSQLYYLNREIEADKKRLEELKLKALSPSALSLTGMPIGGAFDSSVERYSAEIIDLEAIIAAKITQCLHQRSRLERYIADIPDSLTRQIFTLRFINGLSWENVAYSVGGGNTEGSVKMSCYRYLKAK